jgi:glutathione S-transferase
MSDLIVHHLPAAWGLMSISPFCLKLDAFLRMTAIPHKSAVDATPFSAPKGKLPWIEHDGRKIGDSGLIIEYLKQRFAIDPDKDLTPAQRGASLALRRLIEENLYWVMVHDRWMVDSNWALFKPIVLGGLPAPIRPVIAIVARRGVRAQLRGHGIGIHTPDEIHAIGRRDLDALSDYLGDKPYFMGDAPTEIDATAYGLLANVIGAPTVTPVKQHALGRANLAAFVDRFTRRYYAAP